MQLSDLETGQIRAIGFVIMGAGAIAFACSWIALLRIARRGRR